MAVSLNELYLQFRKAELELPLHELATDDGVWLWPLIKRTVAHAARKLSPSALWNQKADRFARVQDAIKLLDLELENRAGVFLVTSAEMRTPNPQGLTSLYFGNLPKDTGSVTLEIINRNDAFERRATYALPIPGSINHWLELNRCEIDEARVKNWIKHLDGWDLAEFLDPRKLQIAAANLQSNYQTFVELWTVLRPRFIACTCWYGKEGLISAARSLGIPVFELQHGQVDLECNQYAFDVPALPAGIISPFPHHFLAYGDHILRSMDNHGYWRYTGSKGHSVGSLEISRIRKLQPASTNRQSTKQIVVSSQGDDMAPVLGRWLLELWELLPRGVFKLLVTLHPLREHGHYWKEWQDTLRARGELGWSYRDKLAADQRSTPELIRNASWHMSLNSSCHLDSLGLGVPSIAVQITDSSIGLGNCSSTKQLPGYWEIESPSDAANLITSDDYPLLADNYDLYADHPEASILQIIEANC